MREPRRELERLLPKLTRVIGEFEVTGRVESFRIDLHRDGGTSAAGRRAAGRRVSQRLPDDGHGPQQGADRRRRAVPRLRARSGSRRRGWAIEKIARFYAHPRKRADGSAIAADAWSNRQLAVSDSLLWRARRAKRRWAALSASVDGFRLTRKLTA